MSGIRMLVEQKSLRRFLLVYLLSTFFLLGMGAFFYYKMSYQSLLDVRTTIMKKNLDAFMALNQKKHFLHTDEDPEYQDIPVAIYIDNKYHMGNFEPDNIHLEREHYLDGTKLYTINKEHKRWGEIHFVSYSDIAKELGTLQRNIIIFLCVSALFIILIALILGKIFIRPMKETIDSLENFIADATHEINTPISTILLNVELSKELNPELGTSEEYRKIKTSAKRLSKIFKDLSFVRLNHQAKQNLEYIQVDEVLRERIDFFGTLLTNKQLTLKTDIAKKELLIDKEDLVRIIDNLLSNAIKYSTPKEYIYISLHVCLEVRNKGQIQDKKHIVKKYHREDKSEGGFGLGLYIIEKICTRYGFTFSIENYEDEVVAKICMLE